jgi:hypothetical protein
VKWPHVSTRIIVGVAMFAAPLTAGLLTSPAQPGASAASGAAFTATDVAWPVSPGNGACLNGNTQGGTVDVVNCNDYTAKADVWLNGGPSGAALTAGAYFFAVLSPSGQADPNDATPDLLSTDVYTNRVFTVDGAGNVSYAGTHGWDVGQQKIQLAPYMTTPNPGGVYILAVCAMTSGQPVDPSSCKYDEFKVESSNVTTSVPVSTTTSTTTTTVPGTTSTSTTSTSTTSTSTTSTSTTSTSTTSTVATSTTTVPRTSTSSVPVSSTTAVVTSTSTTTTTPALTTLISVLPGSTSTTITPITVPVGPVHTGMGGLAKGTENGTEAAISAGVLLSGLAGLGVALYRRRRI